MTDTAIEARDEAIAEALTSGRSVRSVRKEFGLSVAELDAALERVWPCDMAARLRMVKLDLGRLEKLTQVFYEKAISGCIQSGLLVIRVWERKHQLLGLDSAQQVNLQIVEPEETEQGYEKIHAALLRIARRKGQQPDGNGQSGAVDVLPPPDNAEPSHLSHRH